MRDDREKLRDILDAIDKINRFTASGRHRFIADELIQAAVLYYLQLIGEAANQLRPRTRSLASGVRWSDIVKMRNLLVHQYFQTDLDEVWDAVEHDLPLLKRDIEKLLNDLDSW
jgi:uncharacterized protein with HEPN domain